MKGFLHFFSKMILIEQAQKDKDRTEISLNLSFGIDPLLVFKNFIKLIF